MNTRGTALVLSSVFLAALSATGAGFATAAPTGLTVNISTFGAKGDGITNDTAAIQRALDAAGAAGGGTVTIPPGTYRVAARSKDDRLYPIVLRLYSNVAMIGGGTASVIKLDAAPENYDTVWIVATCDPRKSWCVGPTRNIRLENFAIDGSRARQPRVQGGRESQHMHGVMLDSASDVQIRRLTVRDVAGDGIYTYRDNVRVLVEQSTFERVRRVAINFAGTSDSTARDNVITGAQWALKMELDGPAERSVAGNEFRHNVARSVFGGISITKSDEERTPTRARASRMIIADNDFEITSDRADRIGILLWGVDGVRVAGNRIAGNIMQGLAAWDDVSNLEIEGNSISATRGTPGPEVGSAACIRLGGRDAATADLASVSITRNILARCRIGVRLARPGQGRLVNATISGNTFSENTSAGILIESSSGIINLAIGTNTFPLTPNQIVRR